MTGRRALLAALGLVLALAAPAQADRTQLSVIEDDAQFVLGGEAARTRALDDAKALGADRIHSIVFWARVAPAPTARRRPTGFDGADPAAYGDGWAPYDALVRGAQARGLSVLLSPASPIPDWASGCATGARRTCRPNATQYKRFVEALGKRYSGTYETPEGVLPRVEHWSVWNEPNQGGWLSPQYATVGGKLQPQAPAIYRQLVRAAAKGLADSGHASDELLVGETAPLGRTTGTPAIRPMAPGTFLRQLLCLDARGKALGGATAKALECSGFHRLPATGIAHHPYTRGGSRPPTSRGDPTEITITTSSRLTTILRQAATRGRLRGGLDLHYTEYGFQTNPPDDLFGVGLEAQSAYLNQSDWLAYRDPAVRSVAQYELVDEKRAAAFQTGLRFLDGRAKPGFAAYQVPLWVSKASAGRVRIWGQVRPAADDAREEVLVENAPRDSDAFTVVTTLMTTGPRGFVDATIPARGGRWRLRWTPAAGGPTLTSRIAPGVGR